METAEPQPTDTTTVYHRNDDGNPVIASNPICNGCGTEDFPDANVSDSTGKANTRLHVCPECGTLSGTEIPHWQRLGSSHVLVAATPDGWLAHDTNTEETGGPGDKFEALSELGYDRSDVKALFRDSAQTNE